MNEVAPFLLMLCQLTFSLKEAPPAEAVDMLARAYGCDARVEVNFKGVAAPPVSEAGGYFPRPPSFWPILTADGTADLEGEVVAWAEQGVRPGLLLTADPITLALRFDEVARLRHAIDLGAIPLLVMRRPLEGGVTYGATLYAALGLAPRAVYVADGYGLDLGLLPAGRHLVAAHWHAPFETLPIPARQASLATSVFLPVFEQASPGGGTYATLSVGRGPPFTPQLVLHWSFLGIDYQANEDGLDADLDGLALLAVVRLSMFMWAAIGGNWPDLLTGIVGLLAWVGIVIAALLFVVLPFGIVFARLGRHREARS